MPHVPDSEWVTSLPVSVHKQARSNQIMNNVYADTLAGAVEEDWTGTGAWCPAAAARVSNGFAHAPGPGNTQPMTHAGLTVNGSQTARMEGLIKVAASANDQYTLAGFSWDAPGAPPAAGFDNLAAAIGINHNTVVIVSQGNVSVLTGGGAIITNGIYKFSVEIDAHWVSAVLHSLGGTLIWSGVIIARAALGKSRVLVPWVLLGDDNGAGGSGVGLISVKLGPASSRKGFGLSTQASTMVFSQFPRLADGGNGQVFVVTPPGYDSRIPYPAILCFHSSGAQLWDFMRSKQKLPFVQALLAAGYIMILACAMTRNNTEWGNQVGLDTYAGAARYAREHFNIGPLGFFASSMGGIESLLALAEGTIPDVVAWLGTAPTYSMFNCVVYGGTGNGTIYSGVAGAYRASMDRLGAAVAAGATELTTAAGYSAGMILNLSANTKNFAIAENVTVTADSTGEGPYVTAISATQNAHAAGASVSNWPSQILGNTAIGSRSPLGVAVHDPAQLPAAAFRGVPMLIMVAPDDWSVHPQGNALALAAAVQGVAREVRVYEAAAGTGAHVFVPPADMTQAAVRFFNKYTGN